LFVRPAWGSATPCPLGYLRTNEPVPIGHLIFDLASVGRRAASAADRKSLPAYGSLLPSAKRKVQRFVLGSAVLQSLRNSRWVAIRHDKLIESFAAFVVATIRIWIRFVHATERMASSPFI
jgi:hypothetical protein